MRVGTCLCGDRVCLDIYAEVSRGIYINKNKIEALIKNVLKKIVRKKFYNSLLATDYHFIMQSTKNHFITKLYTYATFFFGIYEVFYLIFFVKFTVCKDHISTRAVLNLLFSEF